MQNHKLNDYCMGFVVLIGLIGVVVFTSLVVIKASTYFYDDGISLDCSLTRVTK